MIPGVAQRVYDQGFNDGQLIVLIDNKPAGVDRYGKYERGKGTDTGWVSLRHHLRYLGKRWDLIEVKDPDEAKEAVRQYLKGHGLTAAGEQS